MNGSAALCFFDSSLKCAEWIDSQKIRQATRSISMLLKAISLCSRVVVCGSNRVREEFRRVLINVRL